jgi:hypothetical protein
LFEDYCEPERIPDVNVLVELAQYAKNRDMVCHANTSLEDLCEAVLRRQLPKPQHVRISVWSRAALSVEQQKQAALNAIVNLEI